MNSDYFCSLCWVIWYSNPFLIFGFLFLLPIYKIYICNVHIPRNFQCIQISSLLKKISLSYTKRCRLTNSFESRIYFGIYMDLIWYFFLRGQQGHIHIPLVYMLNFSFSDKLSSQKKYLHAYSFASQKTIC